MDDEDEKDSEDDILTGFTNFVDNNLRVFRSLAWILAGAGVLLIVRRTHVFSQFRAVSDVPTEFVSKNISFHGIVKEVRSDNTLGICHIPLLRGFSKVHCSSDTAGISSQNNLLNVSLPGVELREGGHQWLTDNVRLAKVRMIPLQITANNTLDCILYKRQGWFQSRCVNEELIRQGVAVTVHVPTLARSLPYHELQRRLLKAELRAEKKGVGIWVKPSLLERLQNMISFPAHRMKQVVSAAQNLSFTRIFSRKKKDS